VPWLPIERLTGVQAVQQYPDHTLLIVWPDYGQGIVKLLTLLPDP
jgi:hypothetical protein